MKLKTLLFAVLALFAGSQTYAYTLHYKVIYGHDEGGFPYDSGQVEVTGITFDNDSIPESVTIPTYASYLSILSSYGLFWDSDMLCYSAYDMSWDELSWEDHKITSIGMGAFSDCSGMTSITIPKSVTSISNYAFYRCI